MKNRQQDQSFINKLLFPDTSGLRILYHVCFWVAFILLHYSYAVPTLGKKAQQSEIALSSFLYFLKIIPLYYLCVALYHLLSRYLKGIFLFMLLFLGAVLINHLFSVAIFSLVDHIYGLDMMPVRFRVFGELYLKPFVITNVNSWLVFTSDISETQFLILPFAIKMMKYAVYENIMRQKLQNEALTMELKVLKSQINPHFVFNVLNAAYAKILPISEDAAGYLQKASGILRFSLYETNDEFINLEKEISCMNQYVELESIRNNKRCNISCLQNGVIETEHKIPTLLLITLVENAFKHGVHATRHNSWVDIQIKITSGRLDFTIANSKPGTLVKYSKKAVSAGGIGLINIKKRLEAYFPGNHNFIKIESQDVFRITVNLPL